MATPKLKHGSPPNMRKPQNLPIVGDPLKGARGATGRPTNGRKLRR